MSHEGVEYTVVIEERGRWIYRFYLGHRLIQGRVTTTLKEMAVRRTIMRINHEIAAYCANFKTAN